MMGKTRSITNSRSFPSEPMSCLPRGRSRLSKKVDDEIHCKSAKLWGIPKSELAENKRSLEELSYRVQ